MRLGMRWNLCLIACLVLAAGAGLAGCANQAGTGTGSGDKEKRE